MQTEWEIKLEKAIDDACQKIYGLQDENARLLEALKEIDRLTLSHDNTPYTALAEIAHIAHAAIEKIPQV